MNDRDSKRRFTRRGFVLGAATLAAATLPRRTVAANQSSPMTPAAALDKLKAGNQSFVSAMTTTRQQTIAERATLGAGQAPFASLLSCADSRTTPEIIFNQGLGDLFVVRVAGNVATATETASLEYAAAVLRCPLIVVMGHSACGAVKAALDATNGETFPGDIQALATLIEPAATRTKSQSGDWLANATKENVRLWVEHLQSSQVLKDLVHSGHVQVVGAYYQIDTGMVTFQ